VALRKKRAAEDDEKPGAHARRLALDHVDADVAFAFEQAQITLHGARHLPRARMSQVTVISLERLARPWR